MVVSSCAYIRERDMPYFPWKKRNKLIEWDALLTIYNICITYEYIQNYASKTNGKNNALSLPDIFSLILIRMLLIVIVQTCIVVYVVKSYINEIR